MTNLTVYFKGKELGKVEVEHFNGNDSRLKAASVFKEFDQYKLDDRIMIDIKNGKEVEYRHIKKSL